MSNITTVLPPPPAAPTISGGDTAWVLVSTALVFIMIPGLGYFYSGMAHSKNALSLIFLSILAIAVVSIEWFVWTFSLSFSPTGGPFIGDLSMAFFFVPGQEDLDSTATHPLAPTVPIAVFAIFQCMFASITPALALGATAGRARIIPSMFFLVFFSLIVYSPVAYWTWAPNGWAHVLGALDYAGGGPVHMCSGFAALAKSFIIRKQVKEDGEETKPHSFANIMLGTSLLWFGWFGFNAGSAVGSNARAGLALIATHLAACSGGIAWALIAYWRHPDKKISSFHFCSGAVAGLVAITPASGYVRGWAAIVIGGLAGVICHFAVELKERFSYDDALDVFAIHGIGGLVGNILTGVFAQKAVGSLDGSTIEGGAIDGHGMQIVYQLAASGAIMAWAFVLTYAIVFLMDKVPFLRLRPDAADEAAGMDASQMGELGVEHMIHEIKKTASFVDLQRQASFQDAQLVPNGAGTNLHV
jgi:Amt family ammonium transporter